tara:strand:- start:654 stop:1199 length:546 start_codon:yes stop_codon:yes gene_type:complete
MTIAAILIIGLHAGFEYLVRSLQTAKLGDRSHFDKLHLEAAARSSVLGELSPRSKDYLLQRLEGYDRIAYRIFGVIDGVRCAAGWIAYMSVVLLAFMFVTEDGAPLGLYAEKIPQILVAINLAFQMVYFISLFYLSFLKRMIFARYLLTLSAIDKSESEVRGGLEAALKESWEKSAKEDSK